MVNRHIPRRVFSSLFNQDGHLRRGVDMLTPQNLAYTSASHVAATTDRMHPKVRPEVSNTREKLFAYGVLLSLAAADKRVTR